MAVLEKQKKAILFMAWDIRKFFDSEMLEDVMGEPYKSQVRGKVYRLIYRMNENIRIQVKTPVGMTDSENTGSGVTQGAMDAAIISSVSIDNSVVEEFSDSHTDTTTDHILKKVFNPKDIFHPTIYQDDLGKMCPSVMSAQEANRKMEDIMEKKLLSLHDDKSVCMIMGANKARRKIQQELEENPLKLYGKRMQVVESLKYLGDNLAPSLSESVSVTVKKRL